MVAKMPSEREVVEEALGVLLEHMEPARVARFLAAWQSDGHDYLAIRDRLFAGSTAEDLFNRARDFERRVEPVVPRATEVLREVTDANP